MKPNILLCFACLICATPALADKGGNGKGKGHTPPGQVKKEQVKHWHNDEADDDAVRLIIGDDRDLIRAFLAREYGSKCPPGLAKKDNGCLPPGQAKKRWALGSTLPNGWSSLPPELLGQLTPRTGYRYALVDGDVLLVSEATKKVVDAITLLSAVD